MTTKAQKLKLMHLADILERETDDAHGLTGPQLIERLAERGVEVERKTLYRDLDCLREFGYDVRKYSRRPIEYGLATRTFEEGELMLMADAVQSSKFLTERKAASLVKAISELGSKHAAAGLKRRVHVEGRIRSQNESVYYNIDAIQRAMDAHRKVEFSYYKLDGAKRPVAQKQGQRYVETPVQLVYMDDSYYLIVWNDAHGDFANYRVDRMRSIEVSSEEAVRNERIAAFDVAKYQQRVFGMFNGDPVSVALLVRESAMSAVIDRLGRDVACTPAGEGLSRICTTVIEAPTFYGWLAQFGTSVVIESPRSLREAYTDFLKGIVASYEEEDRAR